MLISCDGSIIMADAVEGIRQLPIGSPCGVCVLPEVNREQDTLLEGIAVVEGPESCFWRSYDVAPTPDLRWLASLEGACGDFVHLCWQRMTNQERIFCG